MIELKKISKKFATQWKENILYNELDFTIEQWEFIAILWKSGCWKTTLLNLISGLVGFDSWEITINGEDYSKLSAEGLTQFRWKNMSFIFQQFHLIPNLTVTENIELPLDINKIPAAYSVEEILDKVWLTDKADSYIYNLSWWEQQRVAIARAFVWKTPILLADEPTWNLDQKNAENIMKLLTDLHNETQNTIIMITHDHDIAAFAQKTYELKNNTLNLL